MLVDLNSFVFDTKTGWNDAKIDLFYLTVVSDMRVTEATPDTDGKSSFMPSLTNKESQSKASQRVGFNLKDDGTESQFSIILTSSQSMDNVFTPQHLVRENIVQDWLIPSKLQISNIRNGDLEDACRVYSTLRVLQDFIGCDKFLDLEDAEVLQNCDSLDFLDEIDYLAAAGTVDGGLSDLEIESDLVTVE